MKKRYILTIDEGTTSVRAILFDVKKQKIKRITRSYIKLIKPSPTWVEFDANEMWEATVVCLKDVARGIKPEKIYGIGITNQRETTVAWNKETGEALCNAISWQCRRTSKECLKLVNSPIAKVIRKNTGLIPTSYFSATKMRWMLSNVYAVQKARKLNNLCLGTVESYLAYRLTAGKAFVTDVTNASRTMLFNIHGRKWDNKLLEFFRIPKNALAKIIDNDKEIGTTTILGGHVPVAGLIADQQASMLGQGCYKKGDIKNTYGTGAFVMVNTGSKPVESNHNMLTTFANRIKATNSYALEGPIFNCTSILHEAIKQKIAPDMDKLTKMAEKCEKTPLYVIPGFNGLGAPYWKMNTKEKIVNIKLDTPSDQIAKAAFEAIALRTLDVYEEMTKDVRNVTKVMRADGGLTDNKYFMQLQANILQVPLLKMPTESTCLGAVICTGLAMGVFNSLADFEFDKGRLIKPDVTIVSVENKIAGWKKAVANYLEDK